MVVSHCITITVILLVSFNVVITGQGWDGRSTQYLVWVLRLMIAHIQQVIKSFTIQVMRPSGESRKIT